MTGEVVVGEVHVREPPKVADRRRYAAVELITGEVEGGKHGKRADARRDGTREMVVVTEVEVDEVRE